MRAWRPCFVLAAGLVLVCSTTNTAQPAARQVLLLSSPDHDPFTYHKEIFRTELSRRSPVPINFFEASSQPPAPLATTVERDPVADYLETTLAGRKLDLVVAIGGPAAQFAQRNRTRLFQHTPLLHTAVETRFLKNATFTEYETAVAGTLDLGRIIDNMLVVLPDTTTVFVVIGASPLEQFWRAELQREFQRLTERVTFTWLNDHSLTEILDRAPRLPPHSAIFYPILSMDGKGVLQSQDRALTQLRAVANAPIFGIYDFQVGRGIVGGPVVSMTDVARHSVDVALRILAGETPSNIKTAPQEHGVPTYDWRELQRWGITEARLPAGSVVQFTQPGVWDQYRSYIVGAIVIVGLQTALIAGLVIQRARRRRMEIANRDLAGRLIDAQETERTRIARDLHDDMSQQLAGLSIMLSGLKRRVGKPGGEADAEQTVATLQERTSALAQSIRNLSHQLHPSVLEHAGLVATLRRHCAEVEQQHGVTVTFSAGDGLDSFTRSVSLCLFRVAQEALANAVRHAQARTIAVRLNATNDDIELDIADDGVGFTPGRTKSDGLGLRSIDERVRLTGGQVVVASRPGEGTKIEVRIPVAAAAG